MDAIKNDEFHPKSRVFGMSVSLKLRFCRKEGVYFV